MNETWKPVVGHVGRYEVSDLGRVATIPRTVPCGPGSKGTRYIRHRVLKPCLDRDGYEHVSPDRVRQAVHRVVALAFLATDPDRPFVNHKDGNKQNNCLANLEWCTQSENIQHRQLVLKKNIGAKNYNALLTDAKVIGAKRRHAAGETLTKIAKEYGVSLGTLSSAVTGRHWKHLVTAPE
jgi:hypothetical protein